MTPTYAEITGTDISNNSGNSGFPQLATSDSGIIYAVWRDTTTGSGDIYFKSSADDFTDLTNLSTGLSGISKIPKIAALGDNVYVVWEEDTSSSFCNGDVYFAKSDDGGTSFTAATVLDNTSGASCNPEIAASGDNVYVVWQDATTGGNDIYFKSSNDNGDTFSGTLNLSEANVGDSTIPKIAALGDNVYVVWTDATTDSGDIYFKASNDDGATFGGLQILGSDITGNSDMPQIAASGDNVYVVWQQGSGSREIYSTISTDDGFSFESSINVSSNSGDSYSPQVNAVDDYVYVAWRDNSDLEADNIDIFFTRSVDDGDTFEADPENLSNMPLASENQQIVVSSSKVFVIWQETVQSSSNDEIFLVASIDNGDSFGGAINLSNSAQLSRRPQAVVAPDGETLHGTWDEPVTGKGLEIFVEIDIDYLEDTISITPPVADSPKWQVDTFTISGLAANTDADDTVTVDWGAGETSSPPVEISEDGSWSASHEYSKDSASTNPQQVVAKIIDGDTGLPTATSDPIEVNVMPHDTRIVLENIASVKQGPSEQITVLGRLIDNDTEDGIEGEIITFSGSGTTSFPTGPITTNPDGSFEFTSDVQDEIENGLLVQAHFASTAEFVESDSNTVTYDVVDPSALEFPVDAGEDSTADLTDFNASITFDNLITSGTVFAAQCEAPDSDRYVALQATGEDRCIEISLGARMELGSFAHLEMEFTEDQMPDSYAATDIDIFHEKLADDTLTIIDITESNDPDGLVVSGKTDSFSRFVLGAANHGEKPEGAIRQPVYLGQNVVMIRNIDNRGSDAATVSLDKSVYSTGDSPILTITDPDANLDIDVIDIVSAEIESETSSPDGIVLELPETGVDTGIFQASFNLVSGSSSGNDLQASAGDDLTVSYLPITPAGRLQVIIDGIAEAGVAQLSDYEPTPEEAPGGDYWDNTEFEPVMPFAITLELVDAQLSEDANITVSMSYANGDLHGTQATNAKLYYKDPDLAWINVSPDDDAVDVDAKTVRGEATGPGSFFIGYDKGGPGGSGGGLAKPGTGVVLDFIASLKHSGGGGHHSGGSIASQDGGAGGGPSTVTVDAGNDIRLNAFVEGDESSPVSISFDTLSKGGQVTIGVLEPSDLSDTFSSVGNEGGATSVGGSEYLTVGKIFDIDDSKLEYSGSIELTIPYDETAVLESGSPEQNVRLLHYDGTAWEDITTGIDTVGNTITGNTSSLSPLAAAIVSDGTFSMQYIEMHPLAKIQIVDSIVQNEGPDDAGLQHVMISTIVKNTQRETQQFVAIVQVINDVTGYAEYIDWASGQLDRAESATISSTWTPEEKGTYHVEVFIWDQIGDPSALSEATSKIVSVT